MKNSLLVLCLTALLGACAQLKGAKESLYGDYSVEDLQKGTGNYTKLVEALQMAKVKDEKPLVDKSCFAINIKDATSQSDCAASRNQAIAALIISSEGLCVEHRKTIYGNEAAWNISLGTLTGLFAGGAAVTASELNKSVLAALALFTNSERSLVNETVYKQALITAVDKKIMEMRETQARDIKSRTRQDINQYTMNDALQDVISFHSSCSFINGLQKALEEGTQNGAALKIVRLKAAIQSASLELANISTAERATKQELVNALSKRIADLNNALTIEELK